MSPYFVWGFSLHQVQVTLVLKKQIRQNKNPAQKANLQKNIKKIAVKQNLAKKTANTKTVVVNAKIVIAAPLFPHSQYFLHYKLKPETSLLKLQSKNSVLT